MDRRAVAGHALDYLNTLSSLATTTKNEKLQRCLQQITQESRERSSVPPAPSAVGLSPSASSDRHTTSEGSPAGSTRGGGNEDGADDIEDSEAIALVRHSTAVHHPPPTFEEDTTPALEDPRISAWREKVAVLTSSLRENELALATKEEELAGMALEARSKQQQIEKLQREKTEQLNIVTALRESVKTLTSTTKAQKEEHEKYVAQEKYLKTIQQNLRETRSRLALELEKSEKSAFDAKALDDAKKKIEELTELRLRDQHTHVAEHAAEKARLERQVRSLQQSFEESEQRYKKLWTQIQSDMARLDYVEREHSTLQAKVSSLGSQLAVANQNHHETGRALEISKQLQAVAETQHASLTQKYNKAILANKASQQAAKEAHEQLLVKEEELSSANEKVAQLQTKLSALEQPENNKERELESEIKLLKQQLAASLENQKATVEHTVALEASLSESKQMSEDLSAQFSTQLKTAQQQSSEISKKLQLSQQAIKELEREKDTERAAHHAQLQALTSSFETEKRTATEKQAQLETHIWGLQSRLREVMSEKEGALEQLIQLQQREIKPEEKHSHNISLMDRLVTWLLRPFKNMRPARDQSSRPEGYGTLGDN